MKERKVIDVYRCYTCNKVITSITLLKTGKCRFCGGNTVRGTNVTLWQEFLIRIGVIK